MIARRTLVLALALASASAPASAQTCIEVYEEITGQYIASIERTAKRSRDTSRFLKVLSRFLTALRDGSMLVNDMPTELIPAADAASRDLDQEAVQHDKLRRTTIKLLDALQRDCE